MTNPNDSATGFAWSQEQQDSLLVRGNYTILPIYHNHNLWKTTLHL
jgi:hypothetical protein